MSIVRLGFNVMRERFGYTEITHLNGLGGGLIRKEKKKNESSCPASQNYRVNCNCEAMIN